MKKKIIGNWAMLAMLACGLLSVLAHADTPQCSIANISPNSGGGDIPSPFSSDGVFELAAGESYTLTGWVVDGSTLTDNPIGAVAGPYFKVDLDAQPWLATVARKAFPYYALYGDWSFWKPFLNLRVRANVVAHGEIMNIAMDPEAESVYVISLETDGPLPVKPEPSEAMDQRCARIR